MSSKLSHAATQWQRASTQRSRAIGAWGHGRPISEHLVHPSFPYTVIRVSRNGIGEKRSPCYRAVCILFPGHKNLQMPPPDVICDHLKRERHRYNHENIIFLLIPVSSSKTVSKGEKTTCTYFIIYWSY